MLQRYKSNRCQLRDVGSNEVSDNAHNGFVRSMIPRAHLLPAQEVHARSYEIRAQSSAYQTGQPMQCIERGYIIGRNLRTNFEAASEATEATSSVLQVALSEISRYPSSLRRHACSKSKLEKYSGGIELANVQSLVSHASLQNA